MISEIFGHYQSQTQMCFRKWFLAACNRYINFLKTLIGPLRFNFSKFEKEKFDRSESLILQYQRFNVSL